MPDYKIKEKNKSVTFKINENDMDMYNAPDYKEIFSPYIDENKYEKIIINIAKVSYIDSGAVGMLVKLCILAKKKGIEFILKDPSKKIIEVLKLANFDSFFQIES